MPALVVRQFRKIECHSQGHSVSLTLYCLLLLPLISGCTCMMEASVYVADAKGWIRLG